MSANQNIFNNSQQNMNVSNQGTSSGLSNPGHLNAPDNPMSMEVSSNNYNSMSLIPNSIANSMSLNNEPISLYNDPMSLYNDPSSQSDDSIFSGLEDLSINYNLNIYGFGDGGFSNGFNSYVPPGANYFNYNGNNFNPFSNNYFNNPSNNWMNSSNANINPMAAPIDNAVAAQPRLNYPAQLSINNPMQQSSISNPMPLPINNLAQPPLQDLRNMNEQKKRSEDKIIKHVFQDQKSRIKYTIRIKGNKNLMDYFDQKLVKEQQLTIFDCDSFVDQFPEIYGEEGNFEASSNQKQGLLCRFHYGLEDKVKHLHHLFLMLQKSILSQIKKKPNPKRSILLQHSDYQNLFENIVDLKHQEAVIDFSEYLKKAPIALPLPLLGLKNVDPSLMKNPLLPFIQHMEICLFDGANTINIIQERIQTLCLILPTQKYLKTLKLCLTKTDDQARVRLPFNNESITLENSPQIVMNELFGNGILVELGRAIAASGLQGLRMDKMYLGHLPAQALVGFLQALVPSNITFLDWSDNSLGALGRDFTSVAKILPNTKIEILNLSYNELEQTLIQTPIKEPNSKRDKKFTKEETTLYQLGQAFKKLVKLDLTQNNLADAIYQPSCTKSIYPVEKFTYFAEALQGCRLSVLDMSDVFMLSNIKHRKAVNKTQVVKIYFTQYKSKNNYPLFKEDFLTFITLITQNASIQEFFLDGNHLSHSLESQDFKIFASTLARSSIQILGFNKNLGSKDPALVKACIKVFHESKTLGEVFMNEPINDLSFQKKRQARKATLSFFSLKQQELDAVVNRENFAQHFKQWIENVELDLTRDFGFPNPLASLVTEYCGKKVKRRDANSEEMDTEDDSNFKKLYHYMEKFYNYSQDNNLSDKMEDNKLQKNKSSFEPLLHCFKISIKVPEIKSSFDYSNLSNSSGLNNSLDLNNSSNNSHSNSNHASGIPPNIIFSIAPNTNSNNSSNSNSNNNSNNVQHAGVKRKANELDTDSGNSGNAEKAEKIRRLD